MVTPDGRRHVFRTVGAGAFSGVPTFLSSFVLVNPIALLMEIEQLGELGVEPDLYASPECLITTFADMIMNRRLEDGRGAGRHGSCGMGIGETVDRSRIPELRITMADLYNGDDLEPKLAEICDRYASFRTGSPVDEPDMAAAFLAACRALVEHVHPAGIGQCKDPVFEGTQGLLLDQGSREFFPHVTRSHTGLQNVRALCAQAGIADIEAYYITRTYLTRHGAGPLPGEDRALSFEDDTNVENRYQGRLRFAPLDARALQQRICADAGDARVRLVVTHRDQLERADLGSDLSSFGPNRADVMDRTERT